jgi:hypothetical protein
VWRERGVLRGLCRFGPLPSDTRRMRFFPSLREKSIL